MKIIIRIFTLLALTIGILTIATDASASTTTTEKVYKEYSLPKEASKFPIKLKNGLTVTIAKANGKTVPVIKKGSKTLWQGKALATNSKIRFTVTKNKDTFLSYNQTVSGSGNINLIGVSSAGKVFLNTSFTNEELLHIDFLSANKIELAFEDYASSTAMFFQLYKDGTIKQIPYFDQQFAAAAKKGQLKWVVGALGTTYKNLKPKAAPFNGKDIFGELELYGTWKVRYAFNDGKIFGKMEPNQKVIVILYRQIYIGETTAKAQLKQLFGSPKINYYGDTYAYKAGKYYVVVSFEDGIANIDLVDKGFLDYYRF